MKTKIQHYLNSLHVYCRLRDVGISKSRALALVSIYERLIKNYLYTIGG